MANQEIKIGNFVKCTRAWSKDLKEPCWYYVFDADATYGSVILKGHFKNPVPRFHISDANNPACARCDDIVREQIVPIELVPDDVLAEFTVWRLIKGDTQ